MSSVYNSYICVQGTNYGSNENIQNYSTVCITLSQSNIGIAFTCIVKLYWYTCNEIYIDTDTFTVTSSAFTVKHYDVRAPILRVEAIFSGDARVKLSTGYKYKPTQIRISDPNVPFTQALISNDAVYTSLTDNNGYIITDTSSGRADTSSGRVNTCRALYVHAADVNGYSLYTVSGILAVNLPVASTGSNADISRHNSLFVTSTDNCGMRQASTSALSNGVGLFYALTDSCGIPIMTHYRNKNSTSNTSIHTTLTNAHEQVVYNTGNIPAKIESFSTSLHDTFVNISRLKPMLRQLGIANNTGYPVWVKVYDISSDTYNDARDHVKFNIAVPQRAHRDLTMSYGVTMNHGLSFRATQNYTYDSPSINNNFFLCEDDGIYITGTYENLL